MAGPPRCEMVLRTSDLESAHALVRAALAEVGYDGVRVRRMENGFELMGDRGNSGLALIGQWIPLGLVLGWLGRTRVRAKCVRSLREGDESLHLFVRVHPIQEMDDQDETWQITQGAPERLGDSLKARRDLQRILAAFEARDFTPTPGDRVKFEEQTARAGHPREDVRERIRKGNRRRNIRLAGAILIAILGYAVFSLVAALAFERTPAHDTTLTSPPEEFDDLVEDR